MRRTVTVLLSLLCVLMAEAQTITGKVIDAKTQEAIIGATITLKGSKSATAVTDINGQFSMTAPSKGSVAHISYVGYKSLNVPLTDGATYRLRQDVTAIGEVVVTARASEGPVTSSIIGRDAMTHLQPNSIADLMELLPGGYAKDPNMGAANTITLRETGTMGAYGSSTKNNNYSISSLGTQFMVDGVPISTDVNMQYSPLSDTQSSVSSSSTENNRNITNRGVDMRSISTDDIESVEVVRGIPSVEYGNLTSGLVNIKKIRRAIPFTARFKADGYSKLFSLGKGLALNGNGNSVLNVDLGYMDSKIDPTDNFENYKRLTGSLRYTYRNEKSENRLWQWNSAFDYSGSFDDSKSDPDINYGNVSEYKSSYSRMALTNNLWLRMPKSWLREVEVNTSLSLQLDRLRQTQLVSPQRYGIVPLSWSEGENVAQAVFSEYEASYLCDGKPFTAYVKAKVIMGFDVLNTQSTVKVGANWDMAKNFGRGQVYDMARPLSLSGWNSRPRKYSDIPALQNFSLFGEELLKWRWGKSQLELMAGVRLNSLLGLNSKFDMSGKVYADPRINLAWHLPKFDVGGKPMSISLNAGYGITTKMPTLNYLYPDKYYSNLMCMSYYDTQNPVEDSKFVVHTYIQDPTNYHLKPARNNKWEVRMDMDWNDNRLSVDYFREKMTSGFRYSNIYDVYSYRRYDVSQMGAGVDYTTLPYETRQVLDGYQQVSNGSELTKQGIELAFTSQRIKCLRTRVNVTESEIESTVLAAQQKQYEAYQEEEVPKTLMATLPAPGKIVSEKPYGKFGMTEITLSNGMKVYVKSTDYQADQVTMSMRGEGGTSVYSDKDIPNFSLLSSAITEAGVGDFTATRLRKALAGKSLKLAPSINSEGQRITGTSSVKDLETMLQLAHLYFTAPRKDSVAFEGLMNRTLSLLKNRNASSKVVYNDSLSATLYDHDLRMAPVNKEVAEKADYNRIFEMYRERFSDASNFKTVFIGNIDMAALRPLLCQYLATLPATHKAEKTHKENVPQLVKKNEVVKFVHKQETPLANVSVFYTGNVPFTPKNDLTLDMLTRVLQIAYTDSVREEKGGTYGVSVSFNLEKDDNPNALVRISYKSDPKRYDELNPIIYKQLRNIADHGPVASSMDKVKKYLKKQYGQMAITNDYWSYIIWHQLDDDADFDKDYCKMVDAMTAKDIQQMAKDILKQNHRVEVTMLSE